MISKTSLVILGILCHEDMSAYDILKRINHMEMKYWWPIGDTTLYETAIRLEKKGFIHGTKTDSKAVYSITDKGCEELKNALRTIFLRVDYDTIWFSLVVLFHSILSNDELSGLVQKRKVLLEEYYSGIKSDIADCTDNPKASRSAILVMKRMLQITSLELETLKMIEEN